MKRKDFLRNILFGFAAVIVPDIFKDPFEKVIYSLREETAYEGALTIKNRSEGETSMATEECKWATGDFDSSQYRIMFEREYNRMKR